MSGIDDQRIALGATEVNCGGQPGNTAAQHDDFTYLRIIEVFVTDHVNSRRNRAGQTVEMPEPRRDPDDPSRKNSFEQTTLSEEARVSVARLVSRQALRRPAGSHLPEPL